MIARRVFTLVELMTVVAIVMVLTAIAIPGFVNFQAKARMSEAALCFDGIRTTGVALVDTDVLGSTFSTGYNPTSFVLGKTTRPWVTGIAAWQTFGWKPEGDVRCNYNFWYRESPSVDLGQFMYCDVDGDTQRWEFSYSENPTTHTGGSTVMCRTMPSGAAWWAGSWSTTGWPTAKTPCI
jgi:hypothetical protein